MPIEIICSKRNDFEGSYRKSGGGGHIKIIFSRMIQHNIKVFKVLVLYSVLSKVLMHV